jgi:hypothetical protein
LRIFALPDMSGLPVDGRLTMALRRKTADGDRKDGRARVDVVLRAGDVEKPVILEKDLPLYAWYAILDASGTPVKWGRWASVWVAEEEPKPAVLSKGAEVVWPLDIKMPAEPGRYSLVVYYEIDDSGLIDMPEFPEEDLPSDQTVPVGERFDNGRLGTVLEGLVVGDGTAAR